MGSWHWRGARGGLQGLHARDRRYDGPQQGQQHRRQGRRHAGKLARGEAGTQPHRRRAGYALGGCGGSSSEPLEVTGTERERLTGSCSFRRSTSSNRQQPGATGVPGRLRQTGNRARAQNSRQVRGTLDVPKGNSGADYGDIPSASAIVYDDGQRNPHGATAKGNRGQRAAARTKGTATAGTATRSPGKVLAHIHVATNRNKELQIQVFKSFFILGSGQTST